jgi:hypothetical protein
MIDAFELDNELTQTQKQDLRIVLSLNTPEEIQDWIDHVGWGDFEYGMSLIEVAALKQLEKDTAHDDCIDAKIALSRCLSI